MDNVEGHPIPQDITGFQFRLIGDMTIKQFAYLAGAAVLAWLFFSLPLPLIIRIPLAGSFALIGIVLAFIPIHGRPADTMIMLFIKAIFKPNQFVKKTSDTNVQNIQPITTPTPEKAVIKNDAPEKPAPEPQFSTVPLAPIMRTPNATEILIKEDKEQAMQQELQKTLSEKQQLETRLKEMEEKLNQKLAPEPPPVQAMQAVPPAPVSHIRELPSTPKAPISIPLVPTDEPNLVYGVVKDSRDNMLANILVEVKDTDGNPVRAFKTNPLGQFASATSLPNGVYTIAFDDPKKKQKFTPIELSAVGDVLQPLVIVSVDEREELRKTLFTQ